MTPSQDVFDYIADHGLAGALEGAHVAPLMRIDEQRATALLVDRVAQVPPRVVVPALQASQTMFVDLRSFVLALLDAPAAG